MAAVVLPVQMDELGRCFFFWIDIAKDLLAFAVKIPALVVWVPLVIAGVATWVEGWKGPFKPVVKTLAKKLASRVKRISYGIAALGGLGIFLYLPYKRWSDENIGKTNAETELAILKKQKPHGAAVTTYGQSGGITAASIGTINMERPGRRLQGEQRARFIQSLRSEKSHFVDIWYGNKSRELDVFANDILTAIVAAGWKWRDAETKPVMTPQQQGLVLMGRDKTKPPPEALQALWRAFKSAEQDVMVEAWNLVKTDDGVGIFIGYQ